MKWSETKAPIGSHILREDLDSRVCCLADYELITHEVVVSMIKPERRELAVPIIKIKFRCGDSMQAKSVSLTTYYPVAVPDAITCEKCLASLR